MNERLKRRDNQINALKGECNKFETENVKLKEMLSEQERSNRYLTGQLNSLLQMKLILTPKPILR